MLADNNEYLEETVEALYVANADEIVRQQCRAREDAEKRERTLVRNNCKLKDENAGLKDENAGLKEKNAQLEACITEKERKDKLMKILVENKRFVDLEIIMHEEEKCMELYKEFGI